MTEVFDNVFIGGWTDARDHGHEFDLIVNCAIDAQHFGGPHFKLVDGPGNSRALLEEAITCVSDAVRSKKRILIHCVAGKSRSVVVTAAALSTVLSIPFKTVLYLIQKDRSLAPPVGYQAHPALLELIRQ